MLRTLLIFAVAATIGLSTSPLSAQPKEKETLKRAIFIFTPNGWMLQIFTNGAGLLQYGSNAGDGWQFKAGTIDVAQAEKDLRALDSSDKGSNGTDYVFNFESERKAPDNGPPARYTREQKVVPGLLKAAADATAGPNAFNNEARRKELMEKFPLGQLPKKE